MKNKRVEQTSEKTIYWGETAEEEMKQEDGNEWCEEKGGRLPTLKELEKAYEYKVEGFDPKRRYWSSTPYFFYFAYFVRFSDCNSGNGLSSLTCSVRCVYDK